MNLAKLSKTTKYSQKNNSLENYIATYVLLKIQSKQWKIGEPLISERNLAQRLQCPHSLVHNTFLKLKNIHVISNNSFKNWIVEPFFPENILGFEPYENSKESKLINKKAQEIFNIFDFQQFCNLHKKKINLNNYIFLEKKFYDFQHKKVSHIMYYAINPKRIDFVDLKLFNIDVNAFFALNGLVIFKRYKKIIAPQLEQSNSLNNSNELHLQKFHVWIYNLVYNQYGEVLFCIKTAFFNFEKNKEIIVTYNL